MNIQLSDHFTYRRLIRFVIPSVAMMILTSIYGVVDGLFVSNFVGKTAFASVNLIMPLMMGLSALGFMIGTGGSAIVAATLGKGQKKKANEYFSMLVYTALIGGIVVSILGFFLVKPIAIALGATGDLLNNCLIYGRISFISLTAFCITVSVLSPRKSIFKSPSSSRVVMTNWATTAPSEPVESGT